MASQLIADKKRAYTTREEAAKWLEEYHQGSTFTDLAKKYSRKADTIKYQLQKIDPSIQRVKAAPITYDKEINIIVAYRKLNPGRDSLEQLLESFVISKTSLYRILQKHNVKKIGWRKLSPNQIKEAQAMYDTYQPITQIAEHFDVSDETIRKQLVIRDYVPFGEDISEKQIAQIIQLYGNECPVESIQKQLHISRKKITYVLDRKNVFVRGRKELVTQKEQDRIASMFSEENKTIMQISDETGRAKQTVCTALESSYIDWRTIGEQREEYKREQRQRLLEKVAELYKTYSKKELSVMFNRDTATINDWLQATGTIQLLPPDGRTYDFKENRFTTLTAESLYWLGFICADGSIRADDKSYRLCISLQKSDKPHLIKFCHWLGIDPNRIKSYTDYSIGLTICRKAFVQSIIQYGIIPRKSYINSSVDQRLIESSHFWHGMIDGDGTISLDKKNNRPRVSLVGNEAQLNQYRYYLDEILHLYQVPPVRHEKSTGELYIHALSGNQARAVMNQWEYTEYIGLERKWQKKQLADLWIPENHTKQVFK